VDGAAEHEISPALPQRQRISYDRMELVAKCTRISRQRTHLAKRQLLAGVPGTRASEEQIAAYWGGNRTAIKSHPGQRGAYRLAAEGEAH
jgi:hypothetical protein